MRLRQAQRSTARISLTPLIDVVFLLLVFFMLASTFLKFNYLPLTAGGEGAGAPSPGETVIVRVQPGGALDVNGEPVSAKALPARLNSWAGRGAKRAVLRVVAGAQTGDLVRALEQARRSRLDSLAVVR
jgi:biopolymer transport protein ExbD